MEVYDSIIIGAGPAGISASLYIKRANKKVLVLYYSSSELESAHVINNYYGFPNGISGKELFRNGIEQAQNLGIDIEKGEVLDISQNIDKTFNVTTTTSSYTSKTIVLAVGSNKAKLNIQNAQKFEGKGISYCAICDGFFYRNKKVVVIGNGKYALHEANDLKNVTKDITIVTNGASIDTDFGDYKVLTEKILSIDGEDKVSSITLEDGTKILTDGIFVAVGIASAYSFAKKIGIITDKNGIVVDKNMNTNIKGLFACGNDVGGVLQVSTAVGEGAIAGTQVVKYLREE